MAVGSGGGLADILAAHFPHGYACGDDCEYVVNSAAGWAEHVATTIAAHLEAVAGDAAVAVAGIHQIHVDQCVCGFQSAVARDRTKHVADAAVAAFIEAVTG